MSVLVRDLRLGKLVYSGLAAGIVPQHVGHGTWDNGAAYDGEWKVGQHGSNHFICLD